MDDPNTAGVAVVNAAKAFEDDPSTVYFCKPDRSMQFYRSILTCMLDLYPGEKQLVCTLPPDAVAVVYVWPRLRPIGSLIKLLRGGLAPLLHVQPRRLVSGMDASDFFEGQREEFYKAHGPFLYLSVVAVRPDQQRRGLGSALLAFICDRADAAGLHCYVEATSPRNQALYERYGFRLLRAWRANPEMPYTYILSRAPKPVLPGDGAAGPVVEEAAPSTAAFTVAKVQAPAWPAAPAELSGAPRADPTSPAAIAAAEATSGRLEGTGATPAAGASTEPVPQQLEQEQPRQHTGQQPASLQAHAAHLRRRQFAARRREQLQRRQQQQQQQPEARPYDEVNAYDMWPLWTSTGLPPAELVAEVFAETEAEAG